jgi:hypothetical protein
VLGLLVAFAGWGLLSGQTWARIVGITLAALSATAELPVHPLLPVLVDADHRRGHLRDLGAVAHGRELPN